MPDTGGQYTKVGYMALQICFGFITRLRNVGVCIICSVSVVTVISLRSLRGE